MANPKSKIGHNKKNFLDKPVEHIDITSFDSRNIIDSMGKMSFASRDTAKASEIFGEMLKDKECSIFLTLAGSTSAGGCMQIYSDLAKDVSGFDKASFSLYDLDFQCPISSTGYEEDRNGQKYARDSFNVCSYVILDSEPLLISDMSKHPTWKSHPRILDGSGTLGYAGFPVINKDNYALGTLCMLNKTPKSLDTNQVDLLKKITANIALLLDLRIEQKEITSEKILNSLINFRKYDNELSIQDFEEFM